MENRITNLKISNFKSIREAELECGRINLFIGRPNVGKSNVLEALSLLGANYSRLNPFLSEFIRYERFKNLFHFQITDNPVVVNTDIGGTCIFHDYKHDDFDFYSGPSPAIRQQEIDHLSADKFRNRFENIYGEINLGYASVRSDGNASNSSLDSYSPVKKYSFQPNQRVDYKEKVFLLPPHGKNLFSVMETCKRLKDEIPFLFEEYKLDFLLDQERNTFDLIRKEAGIYQRIPYNLIADTLQRIIFHYAAIFSNKDSVILFEEPESHSFPPYVSDLAYKISQDTANQYFITTHSPYLFTKIVEETPVEEVAVFITYFENYETKFKKLTANDISELLDYGIDIFFNAKYFLDETVPENPS
ncbi:MAG: AAA family ATPase [Saprospiraceae bacterium]